MNASVTLTTYRYVRAIIIAMAVGLLVSIGIEINAAPCTLGSLSAYYYTPARGLFTAGLVGIGVCLVALRDPNDVKDNLLNVAGMFAPMVALVPLDLNVASADAGCIRRAHPGVGDSFGLVLAGRQETIANNFESVSILVAGGLIFLGAVIVLGGSSHLPAWVVASAAFTGVEAVYCWDLPFFLTQMHYVFSILLFGLIGIYAIFDGIQALGAPGGTAYGNLHYFLGLGLIVGCCCLTMIGEQRHWPNTTMIVELWGIAFFLAFWILQTIELWNYPTREHKTRAVQAHALAAAGRTEPRPTASAR